MPLQLFNDSLSQIFFQRAARAQEERGHFWNEMRFNLLASGTLSVGILLLIFLFARPITLLYLGPAWGPAADTLVLLAPMLAMRSLASSIGTTVFVLRRAHWLFIHNVANASLLILSYLAARALGLGVMAFLTLVVVALTVEYTAFAIFLGARARAGMTAAERRKSLGAQQ